MIDVVWFYRGTLGDIAVTEIAKKLPTRVSQLLHPLTTLSFTSARTYFLLIIFAISTSMSSDQTNQQHMCHCERYCGGPSGSGKLQEYGTYNRHQRLEAGARPNPFAGLVPPATQRSNTEITCTPSTSTIPALQRPVSAHETRGDQYLEGGGDGQVRIASLFCRVLALTRICITPVGYHSRTRTRTLGQSRPDRKPDWTAQFRANLQISRRHAPSRMRT